MSTPTHFKQRLASELASIATEHGPTPATHAPAHRPHARFTVAAVMAAAAVAAVVVPTVSGSGSSPAYAVTQQDDGSLLLVIRDTDAMSDLQDKLGELGVRARVLEGTTAAPRVLRPRLPGPTFATR